MHAPVSIYECHLGSWRFTQDGDGRWRALTYREAAEELPEYLHDLGFTHVEFLPIAQHPFAGSWGYQVTGFYAPNAVHLSLIHISEPTRRTPISYAVFC